MLLFIIIIREREKEEDFHFEKVVAFFICIVISTIYIYNMVAAGRSQKEII